MANIINYAEKYSSELDQILVQESLTGILETPNVNWLDAKTFHIPSINVSGYKTHSRNGGFNRGSVETTNEPYTLGFDRDVEFFVDRADVDESAQAASAANVTRTFMNEHSMPEMDAYRFSKIATRAIAEGQTASAAITSANVYDVLKAAILPVRKYGAGNLVMYVSSLVMDALERSDDFTRNIEASGTGALDSRVTSLDGVRIIEVWDIDRFKTAFDFTDGFVAAAGALDINFLLVAKSAIVAKAKLAYIKLWEPGTHTDGDGYLYQNRMYHDLFVMKNKADGVFVHTVPGA